MGDGAALVEAIVANAGSEWGDEQLAEAIALFENGDFTEAKTLAMEAATAQRGAASPPSEGLGGTLRSGSDEDDTWRQAQDDSWRLALDELALAQDTAGNTEKAEALYLQSLAWREGAEQYRAGHFAVADALFTRSPTYKTVEDATWFLKTLKPEDMHAAAEVVGLLALGEEVAAQASVALFKLALRPGQRQRITECGGLELLAKALAFHIENAELQAACCGALRLLCGGHRLARRNQQALALQLGGADALVSALQGHKDDNEVQREALGALRALARKNPPGARCIIECGAVPLCLDALGSCKDEAVGDAAVGCLATLKCATQGNDALDMGTAEDLEALWEAKLRHEREVGLRFCDEQLRRVLPMGDRLAPQGLLGAVNVFLEDNGVRNRGKSLLDCVVECMQRFPGHLKIQLRACCILRKMTMAHLSRDEAVAKVAEVGGIGSLLHAMQDLASHQELQRQAVATLRNVTFGNNSRMTMAVKGGGIQAIVTAMMRFPQDADLQEQAIGCLTSLCDTVGRATVCARQGGVDAVVVAMKNHASAGHIAELGCMILCMFCDDVQIKRTVLRAGGMAVAKQLSRGSRSEVQTWALELLRDLSDAPAAPGG